MLTNSSLGYLAKQVATWCRGTSKLSIRRPQSFIRQSSHLLPQLREIGDQTPRALPIPADEFLEDCRHAQQHQLRTFRLPMDPFKGKQLRRHTRHIMDMLPRITDFGLLSFLMAHSRTAVVVPPLTQCMGTILTHFVIEMAG